MSDIDLTAFLKDGNVANLDWLDVNAEVYRELEPLPKQNLDMGPDLEALWSHEDKPATAYLQPGSEYRPQTMGDLSLAHGKLRDYAEDITKTARLALMQSPDMGRLHDALSKRYALAHLQAAKTALVGVLAERGLLGKFYISAADFPGCHNSQKQQIAFVRKYANDAPYVVAKTACGDCVHAKKGPTGADNCAVFHKEIVVQVPYSEQLAAQVEQMQQGKGKLLQASAETPKNRIRLAMLADDFVAPGPAPTPKPQDAVQKLQRLQYGAAEGQEPVTVLDHGKIAMARGMAKDAISKAFRHGRLSVAEAQEGYKLAATGDPNILGWIYTTAMTQPYQEGRVYSGVGEQSPMDTVPQVVADEVLIAAGTLTKKRDEAMTAALTARKAQPIVNLLRREMLKGHNAAEITHAMKLTFEVRDINETRPYWEPLAKEAGLFGTIYSTQDSFTDCHEGADFLAKHNPQIRAIQAGEKCNGCIHNKIGRCLMYGKKLVKDASDLYTPETVDAVLLEHKTAGRIAPWDARNASWGTNPKEALKAIHRVASAHHTGPATTEQRLNVVKAFHGEMAQPPGTSVYTRREIVKAASRYMNEGLYGRQLLATLKSRFDQRDLTAAIGDLRPVIAEQGLQGIYYVDPSVYDDYGKGCHEAERLHRSRLVAHVKVGGACESCVHQRQAGFCSKINKPLVVEPLYVDKAAQQKAVLASGNSTEVPYDKIMNNGLTMMAEYQLQHAAMDIVVDDPLAPKPLGIEFNNQDITF